MQSSDSNDRHIEKFPEGRSGGDSASAGQGAELSAHIRGRWEATALLMTGQARTWLRRRTGAAGAGRLPLLADVQRRWGPNEFSSPGSPFNPAYARPFEAAGSSAAGTDPRRDAQRSGLRAFGSAATPAFAAADRTLPGGSAGIGTGAGRRLQNQTRAALVRLPVDRAAGPSAASAQAASLPRGREREGGFPVPQRKAGDGVRQVFQPPIRRRTSKHPANSEAARGPGRTAQPAEAGEGILRAAAEVQLPDIRLGAKNLSPGAGFGAPGTFILRRHRYPLSGRSSDLLLAAGEKKTVSRAAETAAAPNSKATLPDEGFRQQLKPSSGLGSGASGHPSAGEPGWISNPLRSGSLTASVAAGPNGTLLHRRVDLTIAKVMQTRNGPSAPSHSNTAPMSAEGATVALESLPALQPAWPLSGADRSGGAGFNGPMPLRDSSRERSAAISPPAGGDAQTARSDATGSPGSGDSRGTVLPPLPPGLRSAAPDVQTAVRVDPVGAAPPATPGRSQAPSSGSQNNTGQEPDFDDLVEKVLQKLMRHLAVERERRGWQPWP